METLTLHIDRSEPLNLHTVRGLELMADSFTVEKENPKALALTDVDVSRIELKLVFDEMENMPGVPSSRFNTMIDKALQKIEDEGYIHLDAKVAFALLATPDAIPRAWEQLTDADSMPSATSGSIGFYGTRLISTESNTSIILTPFFNRGFWEGAGYGYLHFSDADIALFAEHPVGGLRRYAAVYK